MNSDISAELNEVCETLAEVLFYKAKSLPSIDIPRLLEKNPTLKKHYNKKKASYYNFNEVMGLEEWTEHY